MKDKAAVCLAKVGEFEREGGARRPVDVNLMKDFSIQFRYSATLLFMLSTLSQATLKRFLLRSFSLQALLEKSDLVGRCNET